MFFPICHIKFALIFLACLLSNLEAYAQHTQHTLPNTDMKVNAASFVLCNSCHSLKPGVHLSGPSLANILGKKAGTVEGYPRYSSALKNAKLVWDEKTLDAWLKDPEALVPGTFMRMVDNGIKSDAKRKRLMDFLKIALAPNGYEWVTKNKILMPHIADGQVRQDLSKLGKEKTLKTLDLCRGIFTLTTADAAQKTYWEMNLTIKIDSSKLGPPKGNPAVIEVGSLGDRTAVVFSDPSEIPNFVKDNCPKTPVLETPVLP